MNKAQSKYFNTAVRMDEAFLKLLEKKDFEYITVKEICEKAGVNRSTFYLHYESVADLLFESLEYMDKRFQSYFQEESKIDIENIQKENADQLFLITPQYLLPYLRFIKDHKRIFKTAIEKTDLMGSDNKFEFLFEKVFSPIMGRFDIAEAKKPFVISFYIEGIMGIVKVWLRSDCRESIDFIMELIIGCIRYQI